MKIKKGERFESKCDQFLSDAGGAYTEFVEKGEILEFCYYNYNYVSTEIEDVRSIGLVNRITNTYKYSLESQFKCCFEKI